MAEKKFLIENYGKKSTFASFLPGISGEKGIPIWCYYVNRGQCVVSFGVDNKDHSIMEFYPAHQAYQNVKTTGFRTFVKKDGKVTELFADENRTHRMEIARNGLKIEEENDVLGVNAKVDIFHTSGRKNRCAGAQGGTDQCHRGICQNRSIRRHAGTDPIWGWN